MKPSNKKAIILRGIPHSGKSYYAAFRYPKELIISSDHQFLLPNGKIRYNTAKEGVSHRYCRLEFIAACQSGAPTIVVDDFNIFQKDLLFYAKVCGFYGYQMEIVRMKTVPEVSAKYNWRKYDYDKCLNMHRFLSRQPMWPNESSEIWIYSPQKATLDADKRVRAPRHPSYVKIRKKNG